MEVSLYLVAGQSLVDEVVIDGAICGDGVFIVSFEVAVVAVVQT